MRKPFLEFKTAGWLYDLWGEQSLAADTTKAKHDELRLKAERLQKAIGKLGKGGQARIPYEVVAHEYAIVREKISDLKLKWDRRGEEKDCREVLRKTRCVYRKQTIVDMVRECKDRMETGFMGGVSE